MSTPRANANHSLYLAKILLASWGDALDAGQVPALTLNQAFLPAAREHLLHAYGWFLLEITGEEGPIEGPPPACCDELPPVTTGKAEPGELRECRRLEAEGWLAALLAPPQAAPRQARTRGNLAVPAPAGADRGDVTAWAEALEALFGRMRDSLEES